MIYTVTFNPAIDYVIQAEKIEMGKVNRLKSEKIYFGGKGINVSVVLNELGIKSKALGFVGGFTGDAIESQLKEIGIETDFVHLEHGISRINVKIKSELETELNGNGPEINEKALSELFYKLKKIQSGDTLVLAGSIPATLPPDIYEKIILSISEKEVKIIVDASKELLLTVLKYKPFLIKPNNYELGEIFDTIINTPKEVIDHAEKLKEMGAKNVLVSMAENGAILLDKNGNIHKCGVCKGKVKNSVGAGDSMVAGFIAGSLNGDYDYALKLGTASGGATAFSDSLAKREDIFKLLEQLQ